ncbi:MAG TPA: hypothetical protein VEA41_03035 [Salinarimonas sp.]|nr:hypothetical protein [Salinarimonas sp.]
MNKRTRRSFSDTDKARLVAEYRAAPVKAEFLRANKLDSSLIFNWAKKFAAAPKRGPGRPRKTPVVVTAAPQGDLRKQLDHLTAENELLRANLAFAVRRGYLSELGLLVSERAAPLVETARFSLHSPNGIA